MVSRFAGGVGSGNAELIHTVCRPGPSSSGAGAGRSAFGAIQRFSFAVAACASRAFGAFDPFVLPGAAAEGEAGDAGCCQPVEPTLDACGSSPLSGAAAGADVEASAPGAGDAGSVGAGSAGAPPSLGGAASVVAPSPAAASQACGSAAVGAFACWAQGSLPCQLFATRFPAPAVKAAPAKNSVTKVALTAARLRLRCRSRGKSQGSFVGSRSGSLNQSSVRGIGPSSVV